MIRLLPRSLVGQLMLAMTLALFVAQAANFYLLVRGAHSQREGQLAGATAATLIETADRLRLGLPMPALAGLAQAEARGDGREGRRMDREQLRRRLGVGDDAPVRVQRRRISIGAAPAFHPAMRSAPRLAERVTFALVDSQYLAGDAIRFTAVQAAEMRGVPGGGRLQDRGQRGTRNLVAVAGQLPDGRWITVRARVGDAGVRLFLPLVFQTLILFVVLLGPMLWLARRVARPLAKLTRSAGQAVPGQQVDPVPESGPDDVRLLTRAFNDLGARIRAMLADKDRMLGAVGHDLRTPLASLRVRVEQVGDPAVRDAMAATIADMATMLDDIVALARAGRTGEPQEATDVAALVAAMVADYEMMAQPVSLAADGAVVTVPMRGAAVRRALRNLIDNAVKYGGSAVVGVRDCGATIAIDVVDAGPGIPADQIEALMQPFARAEASRNRDTGGAGLGLALAQAVAEGEGGTLSLTNAASGGLVASLNLPRGRG